MKKEDGRVRITRQMIRTALLNLLREKPLQHITVRELCEKASINRGTFYAHYDDIYDLMEQIEQSMFDEFKAICARCSKIRDPYDLVETITRIFSYIREHADLCLVTPGAAQRQEAALPAHRAGQAGLPELAAEPLSPRRSPHARLLLYLCLLRMHRHTGKMDERGHAGSTDHLAAFVRTLISPGI